MKNQVHMGTAGPTVFLIALGCMGMGRAALEQAMPTSAVVCTRDPAA